MDKGFATDILIQLHQAGIRCVRMQEVLTYKGSKLLVLACTVKNHQWDFDGKILTPGYGDPKADEDWCFHPPGETARDLVSAIKNRCSAHQPLLQLAQPGRTLAELVRAHLLTLPPEQRKGFLEATSWSQLMLYGRPEIRYFYRYPFPDSSKLFTYRDESGDHFLLKTEIPEKWIKREKLRVTIERISRLWTWLHNNSNHVSIELLEHGDTITTGDVEWTADGQRKSVEKCLAWPSGRHAAAGSRASWDRVWKGWHRLKAFSLEIYE